MRLQAVDIAGFRGFAGRQRFDLSADATVIVGANGIGKTSLLDAIVWGLCGRISRLGSDAKLVSLYSDTGETRVSIELGNPMEPKCLVTRSSDGKSQSVQVVIGDKEYKGTSASARLSEMLWPEAVLAADAEEVVSSALIRSVYLQQDRMREFLESKSDQQRFNIICELIGAGRLTELQGQLERERLSWSKATNQREKEKTPAAARVDELERQLENLNQSLLTDEGPVGLSWADWWKTVSAMEIAGPAIPAADSVDASSALDKAIRQLEVLRVRAENRRAMTRRLRELLGRRPEPPSVQIVELRARMDQAEQAVKEARQNLEAEKTRSAELRKHQVEQQELGQQQRALAQIALKLLGETCPVCAQVHDVEQTRSRLQQIVITGTTGNPGRQPEQEKSVNTLAAAELAATTVASEARKLLVTEEEKEQRLQDWKIALERECGLLEVDSAKISQVIADDLVTECDRRLVGISEHLKAGERLALNLARASAQSRMSSVKKDLETAKRELSAQETQIATRTKTGDVIGQVIEALRDASSKVAIDRLEQIEPFLQRVYSRIDPHPAFRAVKLVTHLSRGKGRLNTEVHDSQENLSSDDPSSVLSSSQLNALAVSLFLSFNLALPALPIDAALLDDPIQSLDDIRLLGVVDLLRRTKDRRQLVIATHDQRFGKLLARKLRPGDGSTRTSVIELRGWTRKGPEITQYDVPAEAQPLRLVRAG